MSVGFHLSFLIETDNPAICLDDYNLDLFTCLGEGFLSKKKVDNTRKVKNDRYFGV